MAFDELADKISPFGGEAGYLQRYADVKNEVEQGDFQSGRDHFKR